jgi:hypothetical protein
VFLSPKTNSRHVTRATPMVPTLEETRERSGSEEPCFNGAEARQRLMLQEAARTPSWSGRRLVTSLHLTSIRPMTTTPGPCRPLRKSPDLTPQGAIGHTRRPGESQPKVPRRPYPSNHSRFKRHRIMLLNHMPLTHFCCQAEGNRRSHGQMKRDSDN